MRRAGATGAGWAGRLLRLALRVLLVLAWLAPSGAAAAPDPLTLRVQVDPALGPAVGDARRLEQVVLNLLSNAVKFTERGEVALHAEPVTLPGAQGGHVAAVRIAVSDTGIGIREEDRKLLFHPFRQIDSRLSRQHEGTGLGLAICRRLCDLMNGTIEVQSRWQHGSTFSVTLPLEPGEPWPGAASS